MNRKIIVSAISIVATLSLFAGVTYAQLSATATGSGITFASETAGLLIAADNSGSATGGFTQSVNFTTPHNVYPGYDQNLTFWLENTSSNDIPLSNVVTLSGVSETTGSTLTNNLGLAFNCSPSMSTDTGASTSDIIGTNTSFPVSSYGNETLGSLAPGQFAYCEVNASLPTSLTSIPSGDSISFSAVFTGTQVEPTGTPTPSQSNL